MKNYISIASFLLISMASIAQSADEILAKYFENVGGLDKINSVKNVTMKAKVDAGGMSLPVEMISNRDGKMIINVNFQGKDITQMAFDGTTSWGTNFMTMKAEKSEAEDTENTKRAAQDFFSPFVDYKSKGYAVEMLADEKIEGVDCYKLKLTKKTMLVEGQEVPNVEFYYFDKENYVPILVEQEIMSGQMKGKISQTVYSDYQSVDGLYFAFSMNQKIKDGGGQAIQFDSIELNKEVNDKIFMYPAE